MFGKRGQVTIFIIVAILILGSVALFLTFKGTLQGEKGYPAEVAPIANFVQSCLDEVSEEVIFRVAEGGGFYFPLDGLSTEDLGIAYYLIENKNFMPSEGKVKSEISEYISINMLECIKNFEAFPDHVILQGEMSSSVEIFKDSIKVNLVYPLSISKGEDKYRINTFEAEIFTLFGTLYDAVNAYIKSERLEFQGGTCITCILNVALDYEVYAKSFYTGNGTVVFIFVDQYSYDTDYENALKYVFANKY